MATDKSAISGLRLPWAGKQVRSEQVEDEFITLWHLAADNMRISQNMNVRTSVLNFVICAFDAESAYKASMLLRDLSSTQIARVTLLILDTRNDLPETNTVTTWVTLRSFPIVSDIMRHHFEQVTIRVTGTAVRSSANIVLSLLKPDLPVYLWWLNDLTDDTSVFQRLTDICSRVIVDSNNFLAPEQRISTLSSILQNTPDCAISDLNWGRITAWRELVAQFFDVAEYRPYLINVEQIEIEHAVSTSDPTVPGSSHSMRALLLAAWLKSRLGWQGSGDPENSQQDPEAGIYSWQIRNRTSQLTGTLNLNMLDTGGDIAGIRISIRPRVQTDSQLGTICLIRLSCTDEGRKAVFTINREQDDDHVLTSVDLPDNTRPPGMVDIAATHKESDLLHQELEIIGRDHLYETTLHEAFALLED